MRTLFSLLIAACFGLVFSCKESKSQQPESETKTESVKQAYKAAAPTVKFKDPKIATVYTSYIELKTQLVNSDVAASAAAAQTLLTALSNVGVEEETFLAAQYVMESKSLDGQREAFNTVTQAVEALIIDNISSGEVYKQYCPMAFNNKGAYWLSNSETVYNPYFGDVMLNCGRVSDTLQTQSNP